MGMLLLERTSPKCSDDGSLRNDMIKDARTFQTGAGGSTAAA